MPPKVKYTKEEIVGCALEMVRNHGADIISARNLAVALGTSTAPIFTAFSGIDELTVAVKERAVELYKEKYLTSALASELPFKAAGLAYIRFAKEEPELFKYVFMDEGNDDEQSHYLPSGDPTSPLVLDALASSHGIDEDLAKEIYNHLSVYTYGLAVLFARRSCVFTMDDVDRMLSELFYALKTRRVAAGNDAHNRAEEGENE